MLVAHSLGGLIATKYVASQAEAAAAGEEGRAPGQRFPPLAGLALLAAKPPGGDAAIVRRALWRSPWTVAKIVW